MRKVIFFDIDGTLYKRGDSIIPSTIKAIRALRENGHLVFVCTGRGRVMVSEDIILSMGFDGIIASCGSYGEYQGEEIFTEEISRKKLLDTIDKFQGYKGSYILEGNKDLYYQKSIKSNHKIFGLIHKELGNHFLPIEEHMDDLQVNKFMYISEPDEAKEIFAELSKEYVVMSHEEYVVECILPGVSKGQGIIKMCQHLGIDLADTYGFGDSINDIEMLKTCRVGIAMGNGSKIAKEAADYITDDISLDGIYNACTHFGLF